MIVLRIFGGVCMFIALSVWLVFCVTIGVCSGMKSYFDAKLESVKGKMKQDEGD